MSKKRGDENEKKESYENNDLCHVTLHIVQKNRSSWIRKENILPIDLRHFENRKVMNQTLNISRKMKIGNKIRDFRKKEYR